MAERARHLVERVLPVGVPIRQVVLTLPWRLRLKLARRHDLCRGVLKVFLRAVFGWYRRRARRALGVRGARCGAVTVIQRFGGALNLNAHFHSLLPDGVFVRDEGLGRVRFVRVPAPTTEEVERLVEQVASRVTRWLAKRGFGENEPAVEDDPEDAGLLLQAASAAGRAALGRRAGRRAHRIRTVAGRVVRLPPRCAALDDYNVHAGVVVGGHDEEAVERLCRYVCRPALAKSRIEEAPGGGVVLRFKRPWSDGTTGLRLTDLELVQRLAALVPPPHANMVFYHGVFGPSAAWRDQVVPTRPEPEPSRGRLTKRAQGRRGARTGRRWPWSDLLWHVFGVDGFRCPRCGERMVVRAVVIYPPATRRVLGGLARAAARAPPAQGAQAA